MYNAPRKYKCSRCGPIKRPINWYKLKTKVQDATGTMNLMIFCEVAEELVGVSAEELVDEIEDDDEWYTLPDEIEDLIGSTHTFQVFDKHGTRSFSVYSIMDHVSVPAPAAITTQCKEESVHESSSNVAVHSPMTKCKVEPVLEESVNMGAPTPTMTQCKEEPALEDTVSMAVPAATLTRCKEEPALEGIVSMGVPTPASKCKEEPLPEDALQKPNKRMRGDGWIN